MQAVEIGNPIDRVLLEVCEPVDRAHQRIDNLNHVRNSVPTPFE